MKIFFISPTDDPILDKQINEVSIPNVKVDKLPMQLETIIPGDRPILYTIGNKDDQVEIRSFYPSSRENKTTSDLIEYGVNSGRFYKAVLKTKEDVNACMNKFNELERVFQKENSQRKSRNIRLSKKIFEKVKEQVEFP